MTFRRSGHLERITSYFCIGKHCKLNFIKSKFQKTLFYNEMWITDLRSDTVTKPTPEMRRFMAEAEVGDDVFSEDPTVTRLEEETADLFGKQAALFCPTGCMTNQLGIAINTQVGDEVIVEVDSHVYNYETTAASYLSRVQLHPIKARDKGLLSPDEVLGAMREPAYYMP